MTKKSIPKPSITDLFEHYGARVVGSPSAKGWQKATCAVNDHEDRSPSASVNEDECKWRCYGCGKSGDAIDLIMENENVGFASALEAAEGFLGDGGRGVSPAGDDTSSLLPRGSGSRPGRRQWSPSWRSL